MTVNSTKRALLTSAVALFLCFVMLIGTTFAWFTDEVTSSGNVIQAGTLDVQLFVHDENGAHEITDTSEPIFGKIDSTTANDNTANTLWEPGKTQTVYFSVKNNGSLDLKYSVAIEVTNVEENLNEVMSYIITPDAQYKEVTKDDLDWPGTRVDLGMNVATAEPVALTHGGEHFFALSVHMDELAGNEYKNGNIQFNIKLLAGQLASESDSFDNMYDQLAQYPNGYYVVPEGKAGYPVAGFNVEYFNELNEKIATATIPTDALANGVSVGRFELKEIPTDPSLVPGTPGYTGLSYDITLTGVKAGNDKEIVVQFRLPKGMDDETVTVYHDGVEIPCTYNYESGFVNFKTTSFSPFTATYDETSVAPELEGTLGDGTGLPVATVTRESQYENTNLPWGSYGQWSPTEGLSNQLEAAYTFKANDTLDEAKASAYANWHCDFVVSLDRALGENQIFLGGNYGSFGWVGFHNGEITLGANEEIPLLGSVTSNPWTYVDVVSNVGEFICGVGDVDNALSGATFTVALRLTNPENTNEYYDVATINYVFQ